MTLSSQQKYLLVLFVLLKVCFLWVMPLTGDEAYFISWSKDLSLGYYDHPPAVAWVIYLLSQVSDHYLFFRLFSFMVAVIVSYLIYKLCLIDFSKSVSTKVALAFFVSPISLLMIIIANDVVLLLFAMTGFYFLVKAMDKNHVIFAAISGMFLGLAFLSKYLSAPLLMALVFYVLLRYKSVNFKLVLVTVAISFLFIAENIYFNYTTCWNNILFNLVSRTRDDDGVNIVNIMLLFLSIVILVPPYAIYLLRKLKFTTLTEVMILAALIVACYFLVFFPVSFSNRIGLHWLFLPVSFAYLLFAALSEEQLNKLFNYNVIFSSLGALVFIVLIFFYGSLDMKKSSKQGLDFFMNAEKICNQLPIGETIFTMGYSQNAVVSYFCSGNEFHVAFDTSKYGREDDKHVNFKQLDGENMQFLLLNRHDIKTVKPYFDSIEIETIEVNEFFYDLIKASGFNYSKYRNDYLSVINDSYYTVPSWLPDSGCEFKQKYDL